MSNFYLGSRTFQNKKYNLDKEFIEEHETNTKIYHQYLRTNQPNKLASIIIVHGVIHHSTCFMEVAQKFADGNFFVHLYD